MPKPHSASSVTKPPVSHMARTTPAETRGRAFAAAHAIVQATLESTAGADLPHSQAARARRPIRHGGLGIPTLWYTAGAAYMASTTTAAPRVRALGRDISATWRLRPRNHARKHRPPPLRARPPRRFLRRAVARVAGRLGRSTVEADDMADFGKRSQQRMSLALAAADAERDLDGAPLLTRALLNAACAHGAGRWLHIVPMVIGDTSFATPHFTVAVRIRLGVASSSVAENVAWVLPATATTTQCGSPRHYNAVRGAIFRFAQRAH